MKKLFVFFALTALVAVPILIKRRADKQQIKNDWLDEHEEQAFHPRD